MFFRILYALFVTSRLNNNLDLSRKIKSLISEDFDFEVFPDEYLGDATQHSITKSMNEKKILFIETMWSIVLADGKVHEFESNLIRRLAGLLYISDVSCGNAKKKVLNKI